MDKVLVLYDMQELYAARFQEYLSTRENGMFQIKIFTEQESLQNYLRKGPVDILIFGNQELAEGMDLSKYRMILFLGEKESAGEGEGYPCLLKYQKISRLWNQIQGHYYQKNPEPKNTNEEMKIITVLSLSSDQNSYEFAVQLADQAAEQKKVLFISMELFPINSNLCSEAGPKGQNLSEFIYYLKENNSDMITKLKELVNIQRKIFCLGGLSHGLDLLALNRGDCVRWLEEMRASGLYETVIFYFGFYSEFVIEALQKSHEIYLLAADCPKGRQLVKEFKRQMDFMNSTIREDELQLYYLSGN